MKKISKFIPMDGTGEETAGGIGGTTNGYTTTTGGIETTDGGNTTFKVCGSSSNLPAKQSGFFTKLKSVSFYEIKVELTPYQQKIEDEINVKKVNLSDQLSNTMRQPKLEVTLMSYEKEEAFLKALRQLQSDLLR